MAGFHRVEGFVIVAGWGVLFLFGIVLLGVQLLAGLMLLALGGRQPLLHYLYGAVFPALVLVVCHVFTRGLEKPPYHLFFTIGAFFMLGLTARALMTGLGVG